MLYFLFLITKKKILITKYFLVFFFKQLSNIHITLTISLLLNKSGRISGMEWRAIIYLFIFKKGLKARKRLKALKSKRKYRGKVAKIGYERAQMVNKVIVPLYIFIL